MDFCKYRIDDLLWVRETWAPDSGIMKEPVYHYRATEPNSYIEKWRSPIYMPKSACRLWLRITDIRVERLNDITEHDAMCEGVEPWPVGDHDYLKAQGLPPEWNYLAPFVELWDSINGKKYPWVSNPWVWVVEFGRVEQ